MRKFAALSITLFVYTTLLSQSLEPAVLSTMDGPTAVHEDEGPGGFRGVTKVCLDTLTYPQQKNISGSYPGINLDAGTSAVGMAQRYDVNTPVIVHGFDFFAYESEAGITQVVPVTCNLYRVDPSGLPQSPALATVTVNVDDTYGSLNVLRKKAIFPSPVTVNFPFFLSVESNSTTSVAIYTNNYANHSGRGENLSAGLFSIFWYHGLDITVNSDSFDADVLLHPYVEYMIESDFAKDKICIEDNEIVQFTNLASGLFDNRFFNKHAYGFPLPQSHVESFDWNFGDGNLAQNTFETSHTYATKNKYVITLSAEMDGWKRDCIAQKRDSVDRVPLADFSTFGSPAVQFTDQSVGSDQTFWDFGDGTTTTTHNPIYIWSTPGTYNVTLIVTNACSSDTIVKPVTTYPLGTVDPGGHIHAFPNPTTDRLEVTWNEPGACTVYLVDALGVVVREASCNQRAVVDVSTLPEGLYGIIWTSPRGSVATTFMKQ